MDSSAVKTTAPVVKEQADVQVTSETDAIKKAQEKVNAMIAAEHKAQEEAENQAIASEKAKADAESKKKAEAEQKSKVEALAK